MRWLCSMYSRRFSKLLFVPFFLACCSASNGASADNERHSRFIGEPLGSTTVIVFIHGLSGNSEETWTHDESNIYWPLFLKSQEEFRNIDVFVYEYPSSIFSSSTLDVPDISQDLLIKLENAGIDDLKNIVFIAHNLGGIVVRNFLITHRKYLRSVVSLHFYGTPMTGAEISNFAEIFGGISPQVKNVKTLTDNSFLKSIHFSWEGLQKAEVPKSINCAYETKRTYGLFVVPFASATSKCSYSSPVEGNHLELVKPSSEQHPAHMFFTTGYRSAIEELSACRRAREGRGEVEKREWRSVNKRDEASILGFMRKHPCGIYRAFAHSALNRLHEEAAEANVLVPAAPEANGIVLRDALADHSIGKPLGAEIFLVELGSTADEAGLTKGDVIFQVDDKPVKSSDDARSVLGGTASGEIVNIFVWNAEITRLVEMKINKSKRLFN